MSHESIYRHVWKDKLNGGNLYKELRHNGKKYNKRGRGKAGRGCIPGRIDISERPAIVEEKSRVGDWEIDTMIALLRSVAYGWKQETLSRHAEQVKELGHELYKRLIDMSSHFSKVGRSLNTAVESYNKTVGSLESRVLVTARKFKELGAASSSLEIDPLEAIDMIPRQIQASDMQAEKVSAVLVREDRSGRTNGVPVVLPSA